MEPLDTPAGDRGEGDFRRAEGPAERWMTRLAVATGLCWVVLIVAGDRLGAGSHPSSRATWSLSLLLATVLAVRGKLRGRALTAAHATAAALILLAGVGAQLFSFVLLRDVLTAAAGALLVWPAASRPDPAALPRVWDLVRKTPGDPLAPFAMQSTKSYYFNEEGTAALAYRTRLGYAVVSGDPIGQAAHFQPLISGFVTMCRQRAWHVIVLGCGERVRGLWRAADQLGQPLWPIPIGRDVVVDVERFTLAGRKFRNLRQSAQRTRNAGITTEVVAEARLDDMLRRELTELLYASHRAAHFERGFSMILDHPLEGRYPGVTLIVARDRVGRVQGFQRYATAGDGSDLTLDIPWRRPGAPNGIDERLTIDMVNYAKKSDAQRVSLAFAPFPELFGSKQRSPIDNFYHKLVHMGDPLIRLESLYRYLRKFHAFGERRYVLVSKRHVAVALAILLSLEFLPRYRYRLRGAESAHNAGVTPTPAAA